MRILLSVLFLLLLNTAFAAGVTCTNNNDVQESCDGLSTDVLTSAYGTRCKYDSSCSSSTPGKYCDADTGDSEICPTGMYCPGDGAAYCCDTNVSGFRFSDIIDTGDSEIGARSKYECYKKLDGGSGSGHGPYCIEMSGHAVGSGGDTRECREYYRDGTFEDGGQVPTTLQLGYIGTSDHHWVVCSDSGGRFENEWTQGNHNNSVLGYFYEVTNWTYYSNLQDRLIGDVLIEDRRLPGGPYGIKITGTPNSSGFHMEGDRCYQNTLPCTIFTSKIQVAANRLVELENCTPGDTVSRYVWRWDDNGYYWESSSSDTGCSCKIENPSGDWYNDLTFSTSPLNGLYSGRLSEFCEMSSITFNNGTVVSAGNTNTTVASTTVKYGSSSNLVPNVSNNNNSNTSWECSGCPAGKVGFLKYTIGSGSNATSVLYCAQAVKGCYSEGCKKAGEDENFADCLDPVNNSDDDELLRKMLCGVNYGGNVCSTSYNNSGTTSGPFCVFYPCEDPYGFRPSYGGWSDNGCNLPGHNYGDVYERLQKFYHPCYAGQTTDGIGSVSMSSCRYGNGTLFFDAYGTFKISNINNWTWWYQTDFNNSVGVDVSSSNTQQSQQID